MQLPEKIAKLISNEIYTTDKIGMSESSVLLFENKVLKIQEYYEMVTGKTPSSKSTCL